MNLRPVTFALSLTAALAVATMPALAAAPTGSLDTPPSAVATPPIELNPSTNPTLSGPRERAISGNPLWAIPLSMLSATRERPLFLASRRPPAPVIAATRVETPKRPVPPPAEPTRPALAFVGAVVGANEAIALFIDQSTNDVVRLRTGQDHGGWVLHSVKGREATFQKDKLTAVFVLPTPTLSAPTTAAASDLVVPPPVAPPLRRLSLVPHRRTVNRTGCEPSYRQSDFRLPLDPWSCRVRCVSLGTEIGGIPWMQPGRLQERRRLCAFLRPGQVTGTAFLSRGFTAEGAVQFLNAEIGGNLDYSQGSFKNLPAAMRSNLRCKVERRIPARWLRGRGTVNFAGAYAQPC